MELILKDNLWIRVVLLNIPLQVLTLKILELFLGKGKNQRILFGVMLFKMLVLCYFQSMGDAVSWQGRVFEIIFGAVGGILCMFICIYIYDAESVKILFGIVISDMFVSCVLILSVALVNVMEGRGGDTFDLYMPFQWGDLLGYVPELIIGLFLYAILKKFKEIFRRIKIPNSRIIWFAYLCYFLLMQFAEFRGLAIDKGTVQTFVIPNMIVTVGVIIGIGFLLVRYQTDTQMESRFLQTQLSLMQSQYCSVQQQKAYMEECGRLIDSQMQEIVSSGTCNVQQDKITAYLEDLKKEHQKIRAGLYCKEWTLDAILYIQIERARKLGIDVECQVQNYPREVQRMQCMGMVLMELFEFALSQDQKKNFPEQSQIQIQMNHIVGQEVLVFICQTEKRVSELKRKIKRLTNANDGNVEIELSQHKVRIGVTFAG